MGIGATGEERSVGERVLGLVGSRKLGKTGIHWRQSASEFQIIEVQCKSTRPHWSPAMHQLQRDPDANATR